jgi:hypothetical protein
MPKGGNPPRCGSAAWLYSRLTGYRQKAEGDKILKHIEWTRLVNAHDPTKVDVFRNRYSCAPTSQSDVLGTTQSCSRAPDLMEAAWYGGAEVAIIGIDDGCFPEIPSEFAR